MAFRKQQLERALQGALSDDVRLQLTIEFKSLCLLSVQRQVRQEVLSFKVQEVISFYHGVFSD